MARILFVGDVSGSAGRRAASRLLGTLRSRCCVDLVVLNGENAAGGLGITKPTANELFDAGADVITLGNHAFAKRDLIDYIATEPRLLRPANYPPEVPGHGWGIFATPAGDEVAVISLLGRVFMDPLDCPFRAADAIIGQLDQKTPMRVVDMHAEATSEKVAMGYYLDGRASAVIGTHTHVQTSDERVLGGGTAYLTDAGMTGVTDSVLGLDPQMVIQRFLTHVLGKFQLAKGGLWLQGAVIDIDSSTGKATHIERVSEAAGD